MKYLGIVEALEADIRLGQVGAGDRLPSQRAIAEALRVDLTTVTRAFNEARRRGLIDAHAGRGTFVRDEPQSGRPSLFWAGAPRLDLSMNIPPQPTAAHLARRIPEGIADLLSSPRGMLHLHYQESTGTDADRAAGAVWLGQRIGGLTTGRILVASGAQSALYAICQCLLQRGDSIAAGEFTYPGLKAVATQMGLTLQSLAMDEGGIIPDAFEELCASGAVPGALYVIPAIDNPTTATLSEPRRAALIATARRYGVPIIEDDPYSPLLGTPVTALAEMAGDICWHVATLSKCTSPALRIAYVVAPNDGEARRLAGILRATSLMAPPLMAALASRWATDGVLDEIAAAVKAENRERQRLAASILKDSDQAADPNGHHIWLRMPENWRAADFAEQADRLGVAIVRSGAFAVAASPVEAVRVSLGVAPDRAALEDALTVLAGLLTQLPLESRVVV